MKRTRADDPQDTDRMPGGGKQVRAQRDQPFQASLVSNQSKGSWGPASKATLTGRQMADATSEQRRRAEFIRHINALNTQFASWVKEALSKDPKAVLVDASRDYIQYVESLEDRFLREHGEVFMFGSGECGQLAHGTENDNDLNVNRPRIVYSLRDKQVRLLACGGIHTIAVGANGRVWSWGCNDDGALGRPTGPVDSDKPDLGAKGDENVPELVSGGGLDQHQVVSVSCGDSQTVVVTVEGHVFGWGCYRDKEGKKWFDAPDPTARDAVSKIKRQQDEPLRVATIPAGAAADVSCGASFNAVLLKDGSVLTWGLGEVGELGRKATSLRPDGENYDLAGILKDHLTPQSPVLKGSAKPPAMKSIGCGVYHFFAVSASGSSVYSTGLNVYGQLGHGDSGEGTDRHYLEKVEALEGFGVTHCTGGNHHSMALACDGRVFTWGRADYGQLGVDMVDTDAGGFHPSPIQVMFPSEAAKVTRISCGNNHNLVVTEKNQVYSWGFGDSGALGHGSDEDELKPRGIDFKRFKLDHVKIIQVSGGGQHSALLGSVTTTK